MSCFNAVEFAEPVLTGGALLQLSGLGLISDVQCVTFRTAARTLHQTLLEGMMSGEHVRKRHHDMVNESLPAGALRAALSCPSDDPFWDTAPPVKGI